MYCEWMDYEKKNTSMPINVLIEFIKERPTWNLHIWDLRLIYNYLIHMRTLFMFACNASATKSKYGTLVEMLI